MKNLTLFLFLAILPTEALGGNVCPNAKGFLPDPSRKAGEADRSNPIGHVIILMQENHSFDNYFGRLNQPS